MAVMLDFVVHGLRRDADEFFGLFITTGLADRFGSGDVRLVAGMSGIELAYLVYDTAGATADHISYRYTSGRSREFWAGWALAEYQWETALSFSDIAGAVRLSEIIAAAEEQRSREIREISDRLDWMQPLTIPDHMNPDSYESFRAFLDVAVTESKQGQTANLKRIRLKSGLSQSRLAEASGIPVRTIQQYEQRQKDINKAAFASIIKLAAVLGCEPHHLLEGH